MTQHQPHQNIDIISAALHGDKQTVLRTELALVRDEIAQRQGINRQQQLLLQEELQSVRNRIVLLQPGDGELPRTPDVRKDLLAEQKAAAMLAQESREETKDCWNDIQHLRDVERSLLTQLAFLDQRDRRLREFL
jgi:hypothetical protein